MHIYHKLLIIDTTLSRQGHCKLGPSHCNGIGDRGTPNVVARKSLKAKCHVVS